MYVAYMFGQFLAIILVISFIFLVVKLIVRLQLKIYPAIKKTFVRKNKKRPRSGLPIQEINNSVNPPVK